MQAIKSQQIKTFLKSEGINPGVPLTTLMEQPLQTTVKQYLKDPQTVLSKLRANQAAAEKEQIATKTAEKAAEAQSTVQNAVDNAAKKAAETPSSISWSLAWSWVKKIGLWGGIILASVFVLRTVWRFLTR